MKKQRKRRVKKTNTSNEFIKRTNKEEYKRKTELKGKVSEFRGVTHSIHY